MNYQGKIVFISDIATVGQNGLQKRTVVLEESTDKDYKGGIAFDLIKDKVNLIDKFKVGDTVDVSLNFRTNYSEKTKNYYNSINAWSIKKVGASTDTGNVDDDMPF